MKRISALLAAVLTALTLGSCSAEEIGMGIDFVKNKVEEKGMSLGDFVSMVVDAIKSGGGESENEGADYMCEALFGVTWRLDTVLVDGVEQDASAPLTGGDFAYLRFDEGSMSAEYILEEVVGSSIVPSVHERFGWHEYSVLNRPVHVGGEIPDAYPMYDGCPNGDWYVKLETSFYQGSEQEVWRCTYYDERLELRKYIGNSDTPFAVWFFVDSEDYVGY